MRITYLFDRPLPATETDSEQALQTISALGRAGVSVELVLPCARGKAPDADQIREYYKVRGDFSVRGVPQMTVGVGNVRKLVHAARARKQARGSDILYTRNFPTLFAAARGDQPFAYETYRPWFDQFSVLKGPFRRALTRQPCLGAVLHSKYAAGRYASIGVPEDKLCVAHNGYDPEMLRRAPAPAEARRALGLPLDRPIVAYTGHVSATKGIEIVVDIAKRVPSALFLLVGWDGKPGLITHRARGVANVQLVPWQPFDKVAGYITLADVLLLPPSGRGLQLVGNTVLPMKLFQYLAAGRPILAPSTPDVVELLEDGRNARLVPPGDAVVAAAALQGLLDDPDAARRLASAARADSEDLTWDARAQKLISFLEARLAQVRAA